MTSEHKKFTVQAQRCIKGEAFFESLISDHAIPHRVSGPKDVGVDYFCEWVHDDKPTGVLFAVQVKTAVMSDSQIKSLGRDERQNHLNKFKIKNPNFIIDEKTMSYWRGLSLPVYLFIIIISSERKLTAYFQRFTGILHKPGNISYADTKDIFYKVSEGNEFLVFGDKQTKSYGFARDLFIDYVRCIYYKGSIAYPNPREIGLAQFPERENIFPELFRDYEEKLINTYSIFKSYMLRDLGEGSPKFAISNNITYSTAATASDIAIIKEM